MEKTNEMEKKLFRKHESAWNNVNKKEVFEFAEKYKDFIYIAKTERTAAKEIIKILEETGFKDMEKETSFTEGDKIYFSHKKKSVIAAIVGKDNTKFNMVGTHLDSPRLDLKPNPVYEDTELALLQTHYYGGIKKYQWLNIELAMYGVIFTKSGEKINFNLGENENEERFIISDLLPHLGRKQLEKKGTEIVEAEQLNIFIGSIPCKEKDIKDRVKLNVMKILNERYGIIEEDFAFAEINFVPAGRPRDIGFDKSLIAGYAHDDKSCAYASLRALLDVETIPELTAVTYFADKEEIGSMGNTGAQSLIIWDFCELFIEKTKANISPKKMLSDSFVISGDVCGGLNPNFQDVHELQNAPRIGHGVVIEKYTGRGGKFSANDAHAEFLDLIRQQILQKNDITWQTGLLGKLDIGGGGTIAMYFNNE